MEGENDKVCDPSGSGIKRYCTYFQDVEPSQKIPKSTKHYQRKKKTNLLLSESVDERVPSQNLGVEFNESDLNNEQIEESLLIDTEEFSDEESIDSGFDIENVDDRFADDSENELSENEIDQQNEKVTGSDGKSKKLYPDCQLSLDESAVLLLQFAICHKVTGVALLDLLSLIKAHLPKDCSYFTYVNQLKNVLGECSDIPMEISSYCNQCLNLLENSYCSFCKKTTKEVSQFIKLSIAEQIQSLFQEEEFCELLNYKFIRKKQNPNNIEDVFDGLLYKSLSENGEILNSKYNLSLKVNTDGVAIFKSSSYHLWPVYFQINELPPEKRTLSKYRIFAGLWSGKKKPDMNLLFKPIVGELKGLEEYGIAIKLSNGSEVISKVIALTGHFDTPAKDDFLQKVHHNGKFGCSFCEEEGKSARSGKGHTHVYPYNLDTCTGYGEARTSSSMIAHAQEAMFKKKPVFGLKKKCEFANLKYFDLVNSVSVDYMHTVCLGVVKKLLSTWFKTENRAGPWYIGDKVKEVDRRLLNLRPPNSITRTPRSIEEHLKHYKASELKSWLLHYGPVCLRGILPDKYYNHFLYLTKALLILLSTSISEKDLLESGRCLRTFCVMMEELYGERFMTINTHLLLHVEESVRQLGPLWTSSCFSFEDYNGQLSDFFHGTQHVQSQILNSVAFCRKLPFYITKFKKENAIASKLLESFTRKQHVTLKEKLCDGIYILGATNKTTASALSHDAKTSLLNVVQLYDKTPIKIFERIYMKSSVFHSASYSRVTKRNSYTVKYISDGCQEYGQIQYFVKVGSDEGTVLSYAIIQPYKEGERIMNDHCQLHIRKVVFADYLSAIKLDQITSKCVFMESQGEVFISEIPNDLETD